MFIIGNFLNAVAVVADIALTIMMWLIIAQAVLSWVNPDPYNPIVRFVRQATEPILYQIRRRIPTIYGGIDISPMIALLAIIFVQQFLVMSLKQLAFSLMRPV